MSKRRTATVIIPVFNTPTEEEWEQFSQDPSFQPEMDAKTSALFRFYASLNYPDSRVEVDAHEYPTE